jgi:hypothetical protein
MNLLSTCIHHSKLSFTDHWHTQTSVLSLRSPLAVFWQRLLPREILQLPTLGSSCHSRPCRTLVNWQFSKLGSSLAAISLRRLSTDKWTLTHQPAISRHFLNSWQFFPTTNSLLQIVLLITSRHGRNRKHRFHCYISKIPWPMGVYLSAYCITTVVLVALSLNFKWTIFNQFNLFIQLCWIV